MLAAAAFSNPDAAKGYPALLVEGYKIYRVI